MSEAWPIPYELTPSELQNLRRVADGGAVSDVMVRRLKMLDLIQERFGGWLVTDSGKARLVAASDSDSWTNS